MRHTGSFLQTYTVVGNTADEVDHSIPVHMYDYQDLVCIRDYNCRFRYDSGADI